MLVKLQLHCVSKDGYAWALTAENPSGLRVRLLTFDETVMPIFQKRLEALGMKVDLPKEAC